jgi:hypothetical protein
VAEFQYHNGAAVWGSLRMGQALTLVREPHHPCDKNAVRVDWLGHKLGYVPRTANHCIARRLDRGERVAARIVGLNDESSRSWEWKWARVWFEITADEPAEQQDRDTA